MGDERLQLQTSAGSRPGHLIVHLTGPLTIANLFDFQDLVRADRSSALILDFSGVPYMDSAGLGAVLGAHVSRQKDRRLLALAGVNERVRYVFHLTRVESLFEFCDSVPEAEAALAKAAAEPPSKPHVGFRIKPGAGWGG